MTEDVAETDRKFASTVVWLSREGGGTSKQAVWWLAMVVRLIDEQLQVARMRWYGDAAMR